MISLPPVPKDPDNIPAWLIQILPVLETAINDPESPSVLFQELHREPDNKRNGMVANADGTDWAPTATPGLHRWNGAAWIKV